MATAAYGYRYCGLFECSNVYNATEVTIKRHATKANWHVNAEKALARQAPFSPDT
jgi:hypothetical protein